MCPDSGAQSKTEHGAARGGGLAIWCVSGLAGVACQAPCVVRSLRCSASSLLGRPRSRSSRGDAAFLTPPLRSSSSLTFASSAPMRYESVAMFGSRRSCLGAQSLRMALMARERRSLAPASSVRLARVWLSAIAIGGAVGDGAKVGSCWTEGFGFEDCCAPEFGNGGNSECWDEVYTYESCCGGVGGDPADRGCEGEYFRRFGSLVAEYYTTGIARPAFIELYPRLLASIDSRFKLCAAAVLQASLLDLEERVAIDDPRRSSERVAAYAQRLQAAVTQGLLPPKDAVRWPLELGLDRVRAILRAKSRRVARRSPSVTLVLSYCKEELSWMNSTLDRRVLPRLDLAVISKCAGVDVVAAVPFRRLWRSVKVIDVEDLPIRADECSAYLGYIAHEYGHLPEQMVFIHADAPEHIGSLDRPNILSDLISALQSGSHVPFAHLGGNRITMRWDVPGMSALWRGIFGSSVVPGPTQVAAYCCSHMVVSRDRIRLRTKRFYEDTLRFMTSPASYALLPTASPFAAEDDLKGRLACQNMMFVWHVLFGEPLYLPHRMFDASLPLFLKTRNLRTAYLELEADGRGLENSITTSVLHARSARTASPGPTRSAVLQAMDLSQCRDDRRR